MYKHKRTVAAIAASSLLAVFAAQANKGAHYPNTHKTDADDFKWFVTAGATYLAPSYDVIDYVTVTDTSVAGQRNTEAENMQAGYHWGYYLAAGYMIRDDFDIQASWTALTPETTDHYAANGPDKEVRTSNGFTLTPASGEVATAESEETLTYQAFDLTIGQYHEIKDNLSTRVFTGIRYAKVDLDVDNLYTATGVTNTMINDYDSKFSGWGPEVGMDLEYKIADMVGVVGHFAAAFLIGNQEASSSVYFSSTPTQANTEADEQVRMIPALDAKLGLNVDFPFMDFHDAIVIEGGYQAAYYFNVVNQINADTEGEIQNNYSDVGVMGPYLNVSARW